MIVMASKIFNDKNAERTEFQLHISQFQSYRHDRRVLQDFTEAKLIRYLDEVSYDPEKKMLVTAILEDYRAGRVAIAWKHGEPVYVRMTKTL